jgi:hypothetical protein
MSIHVPSKIEWNMSGQFFQSQKSKTNVKNNNKKKMCNPTYSFKLLNGIYRFCFLVLFKKKINIEKCVQHLPHSTLNIFLTIQQIKPFYGIKMKRHELLFFFFAIPSTIIANFRQFSCRCVFLFLLFC